MVDPFDRVTYAEKQRLLPRDLNRAASLVDRTLRDLAMRMLAGRNILGPAGTSYSGFLGDSFRAVATSPVGFAVQVTPGIGFVANPFDQAGNIGSPDFVDISDLSGFKPLSLVDPVTFDVPPPPSAGMSRVDLIEARADRRFEDEHVWRRRDPESLAFVDSVVSGTLAIGADKDVAVVTDPGALSSSALSYRVGAPAPAGSEVEPAPTPGYVRIAAIDVPGGATAIGSSNIADRRPLLFAGGTAAWSARWRLQWNGGFPIVSATRVSAPPGVHVALASPPGSMRANGTIFVVGGEIQACPLTVSVGPSRGALIDFGVDEGLMVIMRPSMSAWLGGGQIGGDAGVLGMASPAISISPRSSFVMQEFQCRYQNSSTTNATNPLLEDVDVQATGVCSWVP